MSCDELKTTPLFTPFQSRQAGGKRQIYSRTRKCLNLAPREIGVGWKETWKQQPSHLIPLEIEQVERNVDSGNGLRGLVVDELRENFSHRKPILKIVVCE